MRLNDKDEKDKKDDQASPKRKIIMMVFVRALLLSVIASTACFAQLNVIQDSGATRDVTPYLSDVVIPDQQTSATLFEMMKQATNETNETKEKPIELNQLLFPATSNFTPGEVKKHPLTGPSAQALQTMPFYVVGDDERSIAWVKANAPYLKKIRALGLIAQVANEERKQAIENETGMTLLIVRLEGLESIVGTSHYPFLVYHGWIVQ